MLEVTVRSAILVTGHLPSAALSISFVVGRSFLEWILFQIPSPPKPCPWVPISGNEEVEERQQGDVTLEKHRLQVGRASGRLIPAKILLPCIALVYSKSPKSH
jgi:hypothetical protein